MFGFPIIIFIRFWFLAAIAWFATFEVVVLAFWTFPSSIRELKVSGILTAIWVSCWNWIRAENRLLMEFRDLHSISFHVSELDFKARWLYLVSHFNFWELLKRLWEKRWFLLVFFCFKKVTRKKFRSNFIINILFKWFFMSIEAIEYFVVKFICQRISSILVIFVEEKSKSALKWLFTSYFMTIIRWRSAHTWVNSRSRTTLEGWFKNW